MLVAVVPAEAGAVKALLSRYNQSQVHTWDSANPGASVLLHTQQCNDADYNVGEGSTHGWIAEHFNDYFGRFVVGNNMGLDAQYILGQGGRQHYAYPKHITVYNGEVVVMSRNDGTLWRYSTVGAQIGSVKTSSNTGQGMATDGTDLYVSLWNGNASTFVRYNAAFAVQQTYGNPTGLGNFNNIVDLVYDPVSKNFFGIATTNEGGTGTNSTTVVEFQMGGMVIKTYPLPFAVDGIGTFSDAVCGNGKIEGSEECDDGNAVNEDTCTGVCKMAKCGDGFVQAMVEECDDGNAVNEDACTAVCEAAACGDGFLQMGEECDDGNAVDEDACTGMCAAAACGDGIVQMDVEACDDGNDEDLDACSNACVAAACGDGIVQMGEACDDGNEVDDDACSNACLSASCGDGIVQMGEACDDGNAEDLDACSNACVAAACGDGIVQMGEECDDPGDPFCVDCEIIVDGTTEGDTTGTTTTDATTGEAPTTGPGTGGGTGGGTGEGTGGTGDDSTTGTGGGAGSTGDDSATGGDSSGASIDDGCGCTSRGDGGGLLALLALVGLRRRRRG